MIRRTTRALRGAVPVVLLLAASASNALAEFDGAEDELAVRVPVRITAGQSDHLMATYAPTSDSLYFIGNEQGTNEILVQSPSDGAPESLFDAFGDHAFPRVSPNGRELAYISYAHDANGEACVRSLPHGREHCLPDDDSADLEVLWLDDGSTLGILSRANVRSDFVFASVPARGGVRRTLLERNMIGLSRSPDGAFLAYVELEANRPEIGVTFASRVGRGLRVYRLGGSTDADSTSSFVPDLPGVSGFPAFSADGQHIYFSQYLNDTNRDGVIDGGDNGVIVRVGFDASRANPFEGQRVEQLTSARWNCHYPVPTTEKLLLTCSHGGSFDIYSLPLDGVVPTRWEEAQLRAELAVARDLWAKLLIAGRLEQLVPAGAEHHAIVREMTELHLALREYESATFYAERLARDAQPNAERWSQLFLALAQHRRADVALTRGELSAAYIVSERDRLATVIATCPSAGFAQLDYGEALSGNSTGRGAPPSPTQPLPPHDGGSRAAPSNDTALCALAALVASEVADDLGNMGTALRALQTVPMDAIQDAQVLRLYGERASAVFAHLAEGPGIVEVEANLARHPSLTVPDRLAAASRVVDELTRGRTPTERRTALDRGRAMATDGSELALLVDVEIALLALESQASDATTVDPASGATAAEEQARERIFALYTAEPDADRRRAIALRTVRFASQRGSEFLQYQFATTWASGVSPDSAERRYAEELYRTIVLERAYGEVGGGELSEAAGYFFQAGRNRETLDGHIGFIETRIAQGQTDTREFYDRRFAANQGDPSYQFALAYLDARGLEGLPQTERGADMLRDSAERVVERLRRVDAEWPRSIAVHHLWGFVRHQQARRDVSRRLAGEANQHYLLALDLAREEPRARAALLQALATLQAAIGNHRRALEHYALRARLPFLTPRAELAFELGRSRSAYHARRPGAALEAARRAMVLVDANASLADTRIFAIDRLAFMLARSGQFSEATSRYDELVRMLASGGSDINRLKASIGLASSNLSAGEYDAAATALASARALLTAHPDLASASTGSLLDHYVYDSSRFRALISGLEAETFAHLGRWAAASAALEQRETLLRGFFAEGDSDEDLLALAQLASRQAVFARMQGQTEAAVAFATTGLEHVAEFNQRTGSEVTDTSLALTRELAELALFSADPSPALISDARARVASTFEFITRYPSPRWRGERERLELYLALFELRGAATGIAATPSTTSSLMPTTSPTL